jgi:hypothetical protein
MPETIGEASWLTADRSMTPSLSAGSDSGPPRFCLATYPTKARANFSVDSSEASNSKAPVSAS